MTAPNLNSDIETIDAEIFEMENHYLHDIFSCKTRQSVETAVAYASFLNSVGVTPENYPAFLSLLDIENHWVVEALVGDGDPRDLLRKVQPNEFILGRILDMVKRWHRGGIFEQNLAVIMGLLNTVYRAPREGFELRPLTVSDLNAIAKHLDQDKGQDAPLNRAILELLAPMTRLAESDEQGFEKLAQHAASIRNAFLDDRKKLEDVIPTPLLERAKVRHEVAPRERAPFVLPDEHGRTETEAKTPAG